MVGRACPDLSRSADRIDAGTDQVTRERVPEIVVAKLWQVAAVEARRLGGLVEAALRDVVAIEWRPRGGGEHVGG